MPRRKPSPTTVKRSSSPSAAQEAASIRRNGGEWRLLATRTSTKIEWAALVKACSEADIVVSDRWLPRGCTPRWLKLDRKTLEHTGGVSIYLRDRPRVRTVAERLGRHPWALTEE